MVFVQRGQANFSLIFILILVVLAVGAFFYLYKPVPSNDPSLTQFPENEASPSVGSEQTGGDFVQDLVKEDLTVGTGDEAVPGKKVTVHYTGTLTNGQKFDSSVDRGQPFTFDLGSGNVIQGWDIGVAGMKVGGKRKLIIPASLGYGGTAVGAIPANSTLIFEVELLKVE